jgi:glycosyltransferase involved in cell wall biosynthesis
MERVEAAWPRRAVIFDPYPHVYGGAQRIAHVLARELPTAGWTTELWVPGPGPLVDRATADGVAVIILRMPRALGHYGRTTTGWRALLATVALPIAWCRLALRLRHHAGVLHVDDHRGMVLAGPAGRLARVPVVWHVHNIIRAPLLNRVGARIASRVVVPSSAALAEMPELAACRPADVVANGLPAEAVADHADPVGKRAASPAPGAVLACIARLHHDKGLDVLFEALVSLRERHPDLRLVLMGASQRGSEAYAEDLGALRRELGLEDVVELAGFVRHPHERLAEASVYVQPSRVEVAPLAVMEAMAAGLPVVATTVGGLTEMIDDGVDGVLVAPEDLEALVAALDRLLSDPELAGRIGRAAAVSARHRFVEGAAQAMVARLGAIYDELAVSSPARRGRRGE